MTARQRQLLVLGGWITAVLLPLYFNPFSFPVFEPGKVALFRAVGLGMAGAALLSWLYNRRVRAAERPAGGYVRVSWIWRHNPLAPAALIYGIVYVVATVLSVDPARSWSGFWGTLTTLASVAFFLLLAYGLRSETQVARSISAVLLGSGPIVVYGWVQYLGLDALPWYTKSVSPVHATLERSLFLGSYLAMVIPFTLARIVSCRSAEVKRKWGYVILLVLQVSCLALTQARGAWLGFLGGCFLFLCLVGYQRRSRQWLLVAVAFLVAGGVTLDLMNSGRLIPPPLPNRVAVERAFTEVTSAQLEVIRASSVADRLTIWRNSLGLVAERPLLGYGPETFEQVFLARYPTDDSDSYQQFAFDAHNLALNQLMAVGLAGTLALAWLVVKFYKMMWATFRTSRDQGGTLAAIMGSVAAFLIQAQFNPSVIVLWALFWLALAMGVSRGQGEASGE